MVLAKVGARVAILYNFVVVSRFVLKKNVSSVNFLDKPC